MLCIGVFLLGKKSLVKLTLLVAAIDPFDGTKQIWIWKENISQRTLNLWFQICHRELTVEDNQKLNPFLEIEYYFFLFSQSLRCIYTSRLRMRLPHCIAFFYYLPWFVDVYWNKSYYFENVCGNWMWQLGFSHEI